MAKPTIDEAVKRPNSKDDYTNEQNLLDLLDCVEDPLYFMKNFMKVQHATRGSMLFSPYPYQEKIIDAFHKNRNVIIMTGRQQGKSSTFNTFVNVSGRKQKIGLLIPLSMKQRIVSFLENLLIKLS